MWCLGVILSRRNFGIGSRTTDKHGRPSHPDLLNVAKHLRRSEQTGLTMK